MMTEYWWHQVQVQPLAALLMWMGACYVSNGPDAGIPTAAFHWAVPHKHASTATCAHACQRTFPSPGCCERAEENRPSAEQAEGKREEKREEVVNKSCACPLMSMAEHHMDGASWVVSVFSRLPLGTPQGVLWASCLSASYLAAVPLFRKWGPWEGPLSTVRGGSATPCFHPVSH